MKRTSLVVLAALLVLIATVAFAQQQQQRNRSGAGAQPILGAQQTITGTVVSFTLVAGTQHPSLVVNDGSSQKTFVLGPFWFISDAKFSAAAGDRVTIVAASCSACAVNQVVFSVANLTNGTSVTLRDASGLPLWQNSGSSGNTQGRRRGVAPTNPGSGNGNAAGATPMNGGFGAHCSGTGPDMARVASFEGTIVSFTGGPRIGTPSLLLATATGNRTFVPAPYRVVAQAGYTFAPGAKLTLTAAPVVKDGAEEWVVVSMKDVATGLELNFRGSDGFPVGGHGGQGKGAHGCM